MFQIFVNGIREDITEAPRFVRKAKSGAWIETNRDTAEMISVRGKLCNIAGRDPADEDADTAIIDDLPEVERVIEQNTSFNNLESLQEATGDSLNAVMLGQTDQMQQAQTTDGSINAIMLGQADQVSAAKTTDDSVNAIMLALADISTTLADIQSKISKVNCNNKLDPLR